MAQSSARTSVKVINGVAHRIHTVIVHRFRLSDVEDPDLYAAQSMIDWRDSEMGQWIMERAMETPEWHRQLDIGNYGYEYVIVARLKDVDNTFWQLKWG